MNTKYGEIIDFNLDLDNYNRNIFNNYQSNGSRLSFWNGQASPNNVGKSNYHNEEKVEQLISKLVHQLIAMLNFILMVHWNEQFQQVMINHAIDLCC